MNFEGFEKNIGFSFKNKDLLRQAFTHRSYINENRAYHLGHNERLEFLGDAVLELAVTEYLYEHYPGSTEGEMTSYRSALVNAITLSGVASELKMNDYLLLSRGEVKDIGRARQIILANTFEALVGAIFLDSGYGAVKHFVAVHIFPLIDGIIKKGTWIDSKSLFQEKAQDIAGITPTYTTVKEEGPDHDKLFTVGVYLGKNFVAQGQGKSKQDAEQQAAARALKEKGW
ncbi:MAG: ribonuclease III [Candidatus Taylorbacteria bacterium]|nr:ribonuclease III [Candidatus Taylorbacteria bacterium]